MGAAWERFDGACFRRETFVEPITAWDEARRLAFDVTEQPSTECFELSVYPDVPPAAPDGFFAQHARRVPAY